MAANFNPDWWTPLSEQDQNMYQLLSGNHRLFDRISPMDRWCSQLETSIDCSGISHCHVWWPTGSYCGWFVAWFPTTGYRTSNQIYGAFPSSNQKCYVGFLQGNHGYFWWFLLFQALIHYIPCIWKLSTGMVLCPATRRCWAHVLWHRRAFGMSLDTMLLLFSCLLLAFNHDTYSPYVCIASDLIWQQTHVKRNIWYRICICVR